MGGSTDFGLDSVPDDSARFDLFSSINETDSGFAGGVAGGGTGAGAVSSCFALLIGGTLERRAGLISVAGFFLNAEIRSVAG
jgi:hypothetical protein